MSDMKRITPEEVKAAYEATGLKPKRGLYFVEDWQCACGFGAWAIANGAERKESSNSFNDFILGNGFTKDYRHGFVQGFDGDAMRKSPSPEYRIGYLDGAASAALVFADSES